jgi:hypothetical protein
VNLPVGRQRELSEVEGILGSPNGGARTIVFFGEAGIGKTTVWERVLELGDERLWTVLSARSAQSEVQLTYVGLRDLLGVIPDARLEELPGPQRRALDLALLRADPVSDDGTVGGTAPVARDAVALGFLSVVQGLASVAPVLIAVDDSQWLDSSSAAVLEFAARRVRSAPVCFVFAQRAGEPEPFSFERS